jgi:hypothetical protein
MWPAHSARSLQSAQCLGAYISLLGGYISLLNIALAQVRPEYFLTTEPIPAYANSSAAALRRFSSEMRVTHAKSITTAAAGARNTATSLIQKIKALRISRMSGLTRSPEPSVVQRSTVAWRQAGQGVRPSLLSPVQGPPSQRVSTQLMGAADASRLLGVQLSDVDREQRACPGGGPVAESVTRTVRSHSRFASRPLLHRSRVCPVCGSPLHVADPLVWHTAKPRSASAEASVLCTSAARSSGHRSRMLSSTAVRCAQGQQPAGQIRESQSTCKCSGTKWQQHDAPEDSAGISKTSHPDNAVRGRGLCRWRPRSCPGHQASQHVSAAEGPVAEGQSDADECLSLESNDAHSANSVTAANLVQGIASQWASCASSDSGTRASSVTFVDAASITLPHGVATSGLLANVARNESRRMLMQV